MTLHEDMKTGIVAAMKAKDETRKTVLRGLVTAFTNELVANKRKPDEMLSDEDAIAVITREAKKRKDSIEQFTAGGRTDLADIEKAESAILEEFLPEMMSIDEIKKLAEAKKAEMGVDDTAKSGVLMGAIMKDLKGKADGGDVKTVVDSLFE